MTLSRLQKAAIGSLVVYWPGLFILAHIPVPQFVRQAGVSDKSLHFMAYLVLVFLLWLAVSGHKKVNWRKAGVWWILLVVVLYGLLDEWLQGYVGRQPDIIDFSANLAGIFTGLIVLSVFSFWPAALLVTAIIIFTLTNLARAPESLVSVLEGVTGLSSTDLLPVITAALSLFGYGLLAFLWIRCVRYLPLLKDSKLKWLIAVSAPPTAFLLVVKLASLISGRSPTRQNVIISLLGIAAVTLVAFIAAFSRRRDAEKFLPDND